jgi:hypothetical protein
MFSRSPNVMELQVCPNKSLSEVEVIKTNQNSAHTTCLTLPWMLYFLFIQFHPQRFSHDNNVARCKTQYGRNLCQFEIVWYKKILMKSHFMCKVWNNVNPPKIDKNHVLMRKVALNCATSAGMHPRIKYDRTLFEIILSPLLSMSRMFKSQLLFTSLWLNT